MKSIFKLAFANIKHGRGAFKGIILLMMLLTFSFSGTVSNDDNLRRALDEKMDKADIGDVTVHIYDDWLTDDMLASLDGSENVERYRVMPILTYCAKPLVDGKEQESQFMLLRYYSDVKVFNEKCNGYLSDNSLKTGEIYMPYKLKSSGNFNIGSEVSINTLKGEEKFRIKGYIEDPVYGASTNSDNYCLLAEEDFDRIQDGGISHITDEVRLLVQEDCLYIKAADGVSAVQLKRALNEESDLVNSANWTSTRDNIRSIFEMYSNTGTRGMLAFTILLLTVILITMYNSISSSIEMEYTDLGVLKATGFTASKIRAVYMVQYILAILIGALLGLGISIPVDAILIRKWMKITGILTDTKVSFLKCGVLCICITAICMLFVLFATKKVMKISPVRAISGGKAEVHFDSRLNTAIKQNPLSFTLALRHLNSRRKSYAGTLMIVTLLLFFLVSILLLTGNLNPDNLFGESGGDISIYNTGGFDIGTARRAQEDIRKIDSGASLYAQSTCRMVVEDEHMKVQSFMNSEDNYDLLEGTQPEFDNEMLITKAVSDSTGKKIGDTIEVTFNGKTDHFVVTGYFQTVYEMGIVSMLTSDGMEKMGFHDVNNAMVMLDDKSKQDEVLSMLEENYGGKAEISIYNEPQAITNFKNIASSLMNMTTMTMYIMILLFAVIIVVMTCKRTFIRERTDIGIFKAVGFTVNDLRMQFALRFTIVAVTGALIGCVLALLWSKKMMSFILSAVGLTNFNGEFSAVVFIAPTLALSISIFLCAYVTSSKIKTVQVRELITE